MSLPGDRDQVLADLRKLLSTLVQIVGRQKGLPPEILKEAGGKVFTYGSYRLGVYGPGSDIDTLMIAPKHVSRDDFFKHMPDLLRKSTAAKDLTELTPVPGISVPIIKLELKGVSIDLIFSHLQVSSVPQGLELTDNNLLRGLDETDLRCVNGTRVTDRILQLVPETKTFRNALRAIKLWAQRRAVYGNVVGFPGGVAYAMLVARVCQLYPQALAPLIVQKFFFVMGKWQWPQAVILQKREAAPLQLREWDPNTYKGDRFHLMPIITPAYPCMNSTHTITNSTKKVILSEFARGHQIMDDIYAGKKSWKDLFTRHTFFSETYKHYICVITGAKTKEAQQAWSGLVQSKLRRLVQGIEASDASSVDLVQPFNKGFDRTHECHGDSQVEETLDGSLQFQVTKTQTTDQSADVKVQAAAQGDADVISTQVENGMIEDAKDGVTTIWTTTYYMGIQLTKGPLSSKTDQNVADMKHRRDKSGHFRSHQRIQAHMRRMGELRQRRALHSHQARAQVCSASVLTLLSTD